MNKIDTINIWDDLTQPMQKGWTFMLTETERFGRVYRMFMSLFIMQNEIHKQKMKLKNLERKHAKLSKDAWQCANKSLGLEIPQKRFKCKKIDDEHVSLVFIGNKENKDKVNG